MSGPKKGLGGGLFGKESATAYEVYLNLTPLMDVMSNILFFLMAAFGATVVAIVPTTVPVKSTDTSPPEAQQEEKVNVTLRAEQTGLTVGCDSQNVDPSELKKLGAKISKKDGKYDHASLTAALKRIKERYPASKNMVMVPDDDTKYEVIVKLMDAARDVTLPDGKKFELFPEVVLSSTAGSEKK
jgi:biopolymer transport protein ExbD